MKTPGSPARVWPRLIRRAAVLALLSAAVAWAAYQLHPQRPTFDPIRPVEITLAEFAPGEPVLWLDARPPAAFAAGHIPGALALNEDAWEAGLPAFVEAWRPEQRIVVYCDSAQCHASEAVARRLMREFGATRVYVLKGGWESWQARR